MLIICSKKRPWQEERDIYSSHILLTAVTGAMALGPGTCCILTISCWRSCSNRTAAWLKKRDKQSFKMWKLTKHVLHVLTFIAKKSCFLYCLSSIYKWLLEKCSDILILSLFSAAPKDPAHPWLGNPPSNTEILTVFFSPLLHMCDTCRFYKMLQICLGCGDFSILQC